MKNKGFFLNAKLRKRNESEQINVQKKDEYFDKVKKGRNNRQFTVQVIGLALTFLSLVLAYLMYKLQLTMFLLQLYMMFNSLPF